MSSFCSRDSVYNHNGIWSSKTAFEIVDMAKECGVEILKHQTHVIEDEMSSAAKKFPGIPQSLFMILWKSVR